MLSRGTQQCHGDLMATSIELTTSLGTIRIELDEAKAPTTVANILAYVDAGHYSGTIFHRVIPGFMAQGGGYDASLNKKAVRSGIENEADNGLTNLRGTVAMARTSDPHSATAQFFINLSDNDFLNHRQKSGNGWGYLVFGQVTAGMEVVDEMAKAATGPKGPFSKDAPKENIVIEKAVRC